MQCSDDMQALNRRLLAVEENIRRLNTAFLRNDLGEPDYDGHRVSHSSSVRKSEKYGGFLEKVTEYIIMGVLGVIGAIFLLGITPWLKTLGG